MTGALRRGERVILEFLTYGSRCAEADRASVITYADGLGVCRPWVSLDRLEAWGLVCHSSSTSVAVTPDGVAALHRHYDGLSLLPTTECCGFEGTTAERGGGGES